MTTKLEAMVGYLAGRDADPALIDELRNPASEANGFLEATRARSRALLEGATLPERSGEPAFAQPRSRNRLERVGWASAALLALGLTFWVGETRARRLEAILERADNDARSRSERIEAAFARMGEANSSTVATLDSLRATIGQLGADLGQLDGKVQKLASRPESAPAVAEVRDQLATLHRELTENKKTSTRQVEELQASINDVARQIKVLRNLSQPPSPVNEAPPRRNP